MSKLHNIPTEIDGIRFDSKAEARRYGELKLLQMAGAITGLRVHPTYTLIEPFDYHGEHVRGTDYEADFAYFEDGCVVVEDVKGMETEVYRIKAKLFKKLYPDMDFRVVKA